MEENINCTFKDRNRKKESPKLKPISRNKILIGEGKDECNFFWQLLKHLGIKGVQIIEIGGNNFKDDLPLLTRRRNFWNAEIIAITCDGDDDCSATFDKMENAIIKAGLTCPEGNCGYTSGNPKVGLFIFPGSGFSDGILEDLCLKTVECEESFKCVEEFSIHSETLSESPKNISKSKVQVFLATKPKHSSSLGIGALQGYWNFDSPAINELKEFLNVLR